MLKPTRRMKYTLRVVQVKAHSMYEVYFKSGPSHG
jgi:hypothetical protein